MFSSSSYISGCQIRELEDVCGTQKKEPRISGVLQVVQDKCYLSNCYLSSLWALRTIFYFKIH
jgi:hypothetical protein